MPIAFNTTVVMPRVFNAAQAADPQTLNALYSRTTYDSATGCRIWQGSTSSQGRYGTVWLGNTCQFVHRAAFRAAYGDLPDGSLSHESNSVEIHHLCENKLCCEPAHLEALTRNQHAAEHRQMRQASQLPLAA
jgi:hypothetical protein